PTTSGTPSPQGAMTPAYSAMLLKHDRKETEPPAWLLKLLMPVTDDQFSLCTRQKVTRARRRSIPIQSPTNEKSQFIFFARA
ncbi:unnamed protein product, partial [Pylaiella littoralis]